MALLSACCETDCRQGFLTILPRLNIREVVWGGTGRNYATLCRAFLIWKSILQPIKFSFVQL